VAAVGGRHRCPHGFDERLVAPDSAQANVIIQQRPGALWITTLRMASSTGSTNRQIPSADLHILAPFSQRRASAQPVHPTGRTSRMSGVTRHFASAEPTAILTDRVHERGNKCVVTPNGAL